MSCPTESELAMVLGLSCQGCTSPGGAVAGQSAAHQVRRSVSAASCSSMPHWLSQARGSTRAVPCTLLGNSGGAGAGELPAIPCLVRG